MNASHDMRGKTVFVTGGSGGLGKAISKELARRGAHVSIFSRRPMPLKEAREEIMATCQNTDQDINAIAIDMADASKVDEAFRSQPRIADILYCVAGGNHAENGFLADITAKEIESCMNNNYYTAAYAAKSMLDIWINDDGEKPNYAHHRTRKIVFINSAAAFLGLPGSIAYTPAKCAVRALADTLRMEVLRYCGPESTYSIHCAFPADFISPGFVLEQQTKTPLTKHMQGTDLPLNKLEAKFPSSDKVASLIIAAVDRGDFIICEDSLAASVLFTNMLGPSPKRGWGIVDALLSPIVGCIVWPYLRWRWESMTRSDGEEFRRSR
ncbi:putative short chain dehydrogenase/ reductase [Hypoxylon trugodes]|uniref:putative short chain dehydrogenase/ reductase n=1 Tax=Hypoxylon trugodes TaxID=326681 RepID=UPI002197E8D1|nr:putative short chain dehydrogenase/ reductase [Hypoxylon trugodes]KAI1388534.1 putative short chain dehydrogenase/ reductase [Hypoxylon trugodes]